MKRPAKGGRVLFELGAVSPTEVRYRVTLAVPDAEWSSDAVIDLASQKTEYGPFQGEGAPPPWLVELCRAFGISIVAARKKETPPRWPRRVHRWRPSKDAA